jgi:nickel/cobalt transporter (NicO) family protein
MIQIIISTLILSSIHAAIPNHWIPIIAIAKAEKWTLKQCFSATIISGFAHTLSTIFIGVMVGFAGYKLSERYEFISQQLAPIILMSLGVIYIFLDIQKGRKHSHSHHHHEFGNKSGTSRSVLFSLTLSMFFTPCVEIEAYYFQAGVFGWNGIIAVSVVYTLTTVILMLLLVFAGLKSIERIRSHTLEHHEKLITGIVLLILGLLAFFVRF